jgi:hypothetical protein
MCSVEVAQPVECVLQPRDVHSTKMPALFDSASGAGCVL